jgi:hypothetical protein
MSKNKNGYEQVVDDTAAARRGVSPGILVNTYGTRAPAAAKFGVGTSTREGAKEAADAQRAQRPGDAER